MCISYGQPDHRMLFLDKVTNNVSQLKHPNTHCLQPKYGWTISVEQVHKPTISTSIQLTAEDKDNPNVHFVYICKKVSVCESKSIISLLKNLTISSREFKQRPSPQIEGEESL